jgi:tetratricopeptide (TPR) repeat protein
MPFLETVIIFRTNHFAIYIGYNRDMPSGADRLRWGKLLLPFLIAIAFSLFPRSFIAESALDQSRRTDPKIAAPALARAAEELSWRKDLIEKAGSAALLAGDFNTAVELLSRAKAGGGISAEGLIALGDAYMALNQPADAVGAWHAVLANPGMDHTKAYARLAAAFWTSQNFSALREVLVAHLRETPQDSQTVYQLGLLEAVDDPRSALDRLNQAALLDPQLSDKAHTIEAGLLLADKTTDPSYRFLLIGRALGSAGEWGSARRAFQQALDQNSSNYEARAFLGEARYQLGQDGSADLRAALQADPGSVLIQALQAMTFLREGKPERAIVYLHAAASEEPDNPVWQAQLGDTLSLLGDLDAAAAYYQAAAHLAPKDAAYWQLLVRFCLKYQYQVGEVGLAAARQAVLLDEKDAVSLDLIGQVFTSLGDLISAQRFFERAIQASPENADAHLHLGFLLIQSGDSSEAQRQLLLVSILQPNSDAGQQAGRLLKQYFP